MKNYLWLFIELVGFGFVMYGEFTIGTFFFTLSFLMIIWDRIGESYENICELVENNHKELLKEVRKK